MLAPLDKHILAVIQSNARLSYTELASHVRSTPTSCRNRLQYLERAGYILDYTALLDPAKLGMPLLMFIEITLDRTHPEAFGRLPEVVSEVPEVLECHRVTGRFDFLVKMRVKDVSACTALLSSMLHACPGIRRIYTRMVVEEIVCMPGVPLARNTATV